MTFEGKRILARIEEAKKDKRGIKITTKNNLNCQSCQIDPIKDSIHAAATTYLIGM